MFHGTSVPDPYRWMEDLKSKELNTWKDAQHQVADEYLKRTGWPQRVRGLLEELDSSPSFGMPTVASGRYVWTETIPGFEQPVMKTKVGRNGAESTLIDVNAIAADGSLSLSSWSLSPDGKILVYSLRKKGMQQFTLYEKLLSGETAPRTIPNPSSLSGSDGVAWVGGSTGFFYTREMPDESGTTAKPAAPFQAIYYHTAGKDPSTDIFVFGGKEYPGWRFSSLTFSDGRYLVVRFWKKTGLTRGVAMIPLENGIAQASKVQLIDADLAAWSKPLGVQDGKLVMLTNGDAEKYRVVEVDPAKPAMKDWATLVAAADRVIEDAIQVRGKIGVAFLKDASSELAIYDNKGKLLKHVDLPGMGALSAFKPDTASGTLFFGYQSLIQPLTVYELNLEDYTYGVHKAPKTSFVSSKYELYRDFVTARDGTRIPVFVAHKKGLVRDGKSPFLLLGYGGFAQPMGPGFTLRDAAWLEMGGGMVVACGRGGGEYGEQWHRDGAGLNKKTAINDFVDVADWLLAKKYTTAKRLGINGLSHGGMLVSAALNQRPEMFAVVVNNLGLTDMIRYETSNTGFDWTDEFGSVKDEAGFKSLFAYSPLHNIQEKKAYPPVMVIAADLDDRVLPWHQYKYAAALQNSDTGASPKLLYVSYGTGHYYGKSKSATLGERIAALSFIAHNLGMRPN